VKHIDVYYNPKTKCWHAWFNGRGLSGINPGEFEPDVERKFYTFSYFCEVAKQYARDDKICKED